MPLPLLAAAGISMAAKEGFSLLNNSIADNQAREMAAYNDRLQRKLMVDSPSLNAAGLRRAGFSVASLNGNFSSTPSTGNASAPAAPETPDPAASLSAAMSLETQKKQNELLDQQIRKQKLDNDEQEDRQNAYRNASPSYWIDDDGKRVYSDDPDNNQRADTYVKNHPGELPEVVKDEGHLSNEAYAATSNIAGNRNNYYQNLLGAQVAKLKMADKKVMYAISHVDKQSYDNLVQTGKNLLKDWHIKDNQIKIGNIDIDIRKIDKDIREQQKLEEVINYKLLKLRYETERDTNIRPLVSNLLNNGFDMSTIGKLLVAVLLKQFNM